MATMLVMFTGGTIGSRKSDRTIDVDAAAAYRLIEAYRASPGNRGVAFETKQPLNILSENMLPADWLTLAASLQEADMAQYDGVIVTHGSDTLAYTAACLSYAFHDIRVPLVLTASNYPLDDPRNVGQRNFGDAIDFILDRRLPGVFVVYENDKGESVVHLGTRLLQAAPFTDQYASTYDVPFGRMKNGKFVPDPHPLNPSPERLHAQQTRGRVFPFGRLAFSTDILYIRPYPGTNYEWFDFAHRRPKAVLHDLYHSGTACTREAEGGQYSFHRFIAYCRSYGVTVYAAPIKNASGDLYASSVAMLQAGAVAMENVSIEAALVKLMLAYGMFGTEEEAAALVNGPALFFENHK
ncbi:asparaginase [Paenibacillus cymbidii]|uniref:asparaginase n=1 Tax=Paenibacillus cymbidii TaxID=1639034 RepID=UPI0014367537|nr:asparaginase domain-containing protein [Paenibacillus cymbidii]